MPIRSLATLTALAVLCPSSLSAPQSVQLPKDVVNVPSAGQAVKKAAPAPDMFPAATGDLALDWPSDGAPPSLLEVAMKYGQLTGQLVLTEPQHRDLLNAARLPLDRPTTVPAAEVQSFFESLLSTSDFVLMIAREEEPRLVRIQSLQTASRNNIRASARVVPANDLALLRRHSAMLFTTVVDLPNTDVRQLSNSLRTMITDANTMQLLPAGNSTTLVITGFGPYVADMVEQVQLIDAHSVVPKVPKVTITHEFIRLRHAIAADTAALVERALVSAREQRSGIVAAAPAAGVSGPMPRPAPSVVADVRLNALLVTCPDEELADARRVIALLDVQ
jgi:type II secretory pathway component GspD/PulD (secretin)